MFVTHDPLGNPVDRRHPWNQHTNPKPQKRDFDDKYSWVMSPRWYDGKDHLALDTGGGPLARLWSTALAGLVDIGYVKATGHQRADQPAEDRAQGPGVASSGRSRSGATRSSATARAPTSRPTPPPARCTSSRRRWSRSGPATPRPGSRSRCPDEAHRLRLHRGGARRAVAPHGDPRRQDRELPPLPADAVERQPARRLRHAGPVRGRGAGPADLRGERPGELQGHRHHADRAQLRPLPAVRRPHVPRRRQDAGEAALARPGVGR